MNETLCFWAKRYVTYHSHVGLVTTHFLARHLLALTWSKSWVFKTFKTKVSAWELGFDVRIALDYFKTGAVIIYQVHAATRAMTTRITCHHTISPTWKKYGPDWL